MPKSDNKWSQVIENKQYRNEGLKLSNKKKVLIRNCDFSYNVDDTSMLTLNNCRHCRIEKCKFHDKTTLGVGLKIAGEKTENIVVDGCEFSRFTFRERNGGEPVRIGNSSTSGCWFNCVVKNCRFHDLKADPETISIKACGIVVENCDHENNKSSFVIRHGGYAIIRNNRFKGEGGIRIYGYGNIITGNHFEDNQSDKFPPITLGAGDIKKDPNWIDVETPSGRKGVSHARYAQINNITIKDNTKHHCRKGIVTRTDKPLRPINTDIEDLSESAEPRRAAEEIDELELREAIEDLEQEEEEEEEEVSRRKQRRRT